MQVVINGEVFECWLIRYLSLALKRRPSVEASKMAALKFTGLIFLVYFTIFANAGKKFCKRADKKLADLKTLIENLDCSGQGTTFCFRNYFILFSPRFDITDFPSFHICSYINSDTIPCGFSHLIDYLPILFCIYC